MAPRDHARHAPGRPNRPAAPRSGNGTGPDPSSSDRTPSHRSARRPRPSTRYAPSNFAPSSSARFGTSSSPATTRPLHRLDPDPRRKNLPLVIDNPRFLILPWIRISNLGSHILAIVCGRFQHDWACRYNHPRPHKDLRRGPPLHRRRLQSLRLDPRRNHTGTRALRHRQAVRQAHQDVWLRPLAPLKTHPQPTEPHPPAAALGGSKATPTQRVRLQR